MSAGLRLPTQCRKKEKKNRSEQPSKKDVRCIRWCRAQQANDLFRLAPSQIIPSFPTYASTKHMTYLSLAMQTTFYRYANRITEYGTIDGGNTTATKKNEDNDKLVVLVRPPYKRGRNGGYHGHTTSIDLPRELNWRNGAQHVRQWTAVTCAQLNAPMAWENAPGSTHHFRQKWRKMMANALRLVDSASCTRLFESPH